MDLPHLPALPQPTAALPSCRSLCHRWPSLPPPPSTVISMSRIVIALLCRRPLRLHHCCRRPTAFVPPPPPSPITTLANAHHHCCRHSSWIAPLSINRKAVYHAAAHPPLSNCTAYQGACGLAAGGREGGGHGSSERVSGRR